ncbi:L-lactate dehydrogenase (cytochrome) [Ancylobacter aquaticus]|uniref:L-lactate dehydrogenase (Cytochrome) n=1 Tax=Ancylobacter aquaticus TaxID=100 RepID=A0A4R1H8T1_ANCAQ|nr:alpha-hydroxy acid oxidase [Ancylobacter aquaticus]TCK16580.1 L-lactate dehydrogenase (cytochrome) [Ancylobacter aquaticus]
MDTNMAAAQAVPLVSAPRTARAADAAKPMARRFRKLLALDDFEKAARRHLPRMVYGFVAGASETGSALRQSRTGYDRIAFLPRTLMDVSGRTTATRLFETDYSAPIGICPFGGAAMVAYRGDLALARAARHAGVPMILSASSLIPLEDVQRENPDAWFQAYLAGDLARIEPLVKRVADAGFGTLVVTADHPVPSNRENNLRNGFSMPIKITPQTMLDSLLHPSWLCGTILRTVLRHGIPHFENMDAHRGPPMFSQHAVRNINSRDQLAWSHVAEIRRMWKGKLVIKGVLSLGDVLKAKEAGADGVILSSHGGRQLDYAVAPIDMLPEIVAAKTGLVTMIDGGVRRGTDVLKALALGADFVFVGRPFLYAAAIGGAAAVEHAIGLLVDEIDRDMALLGARNRSEITSDLLR